MRFHLAFTCLLVLSVFILTDMVNGYYGRGHFFNDDALDKLAAIFGSSWSKQSPHALRAMMSERVPVSVARAIINRYENQHGSGVVLSPVLRNLQNREDFLLTLLILQQMRNTIGTTILDGLQKQDTDRTYSFTADACNCSLYFVDETDHKVKGLVPDLIEEVCKEAGKRCTLEYAPYDKCHVGGIGTEYEAAGVGLLSRQFDGCPVTKNAEMSRAFGFTDRLLEYDGPSRFFVPVGNPGNFNPKDITGKTIGVIKGWNSNLRCLLENKVKGTKALTSKQLRAMGGISELSRAVLDNQIDACFVLLWPNGDVDEEHAGMIGGTPDGLEPVGDVFRCSEDWS
ncbi:uncharacterized protein [Ptychodera flava]|uniref:uncharacterized protein isoform X2 n=1 Tax=Ptychodera flava TaxID=63121 RepID=UPI00396A3392